MSESNESQDEQKKNKRKQEPRSRVTAWLEYEDSSVPDSVERARAWHVRGFVSPWHDRDVLVDGSPKKKHRHWLIFNEGKKSRAQIDELREAIMGPNYNRGLETIANPGAYARYLCHMDDPDKAQYKREDVISLGGADYDLASSMPGDDSVVMAEISAYVVASDVTSVNSLITICKAQGRKDWMSYISRRGYVIGMMIGHNLKRLERIRAGMALPGDEVGGGAVAENQ